MSLESRIPVIVALDVKNDITSFLNFVNQQKEETEFIFSSVDLPSHTFDDSILVIGDVLNAYVYTATDVNHEVGGLYKFDTLKDAYFNGIKHINDIIDKYAFYPGDIVEMALRLTVRVELAKKYNAKDIVIGDYDDESILAYNPIVLNKVKEYFEKDGFNFITLGSAEDTIADDFIKEHDIETYASYKDRLIDIAKFDESKVDDYLAYIDNELYPFLDELISENTILRGNDEQ